VRTDIESNSAILSLLRLVALSAAKPIQEVQFPAQDVGDGSGNVEISNRTLHSTVESFLAARANKVSRSGSTTKSKSSGKAKRKRKRQPASVPSGLVRNRNAAEDIAAQLQVKLSSLPVYYPTLMTATGSYRTTDARAYDIVDRTGKRHRAYRIVAYAGRIGQYYGIQGTDWRSPPILDDATRRETVDGRKYELFYDGSRIKLVAWRSRRGSYWVSNTLLRSLTNQQMLAIAHSLRSLGGR
jgi:polyisoprenyl-teichoic acid--peptidoglycan teichoic acid transferase